MLLQGLLSLDPRNQKHRLVFRQRPLLHRFHIDILDCRRQVDLITATHGFEVHQLVLLE